MKALPFKKRSFFATPSEPLGGVRHESTKGVSLNELQLQRIGKFLESKNKKLKVGLSAQQLTVCQQAASPTPKIVTHSLSAALVHLMKT
jgi:hypothetical protein